MNEAAMPAWAESEVQSVDYYSRRYIEGCSRGRIDRIRREMAMRKTRQKVAVYEPSIFNPWNFEYESTEGQNRGRWRMNVLLHCLCNVVQIVPNNGVYCVTEYRWG